jgi:hypothetical protein
MPEASPVPETSPLCDIDVNHVDDTCKDVNLDDIKAQLSMLQTMISQFEQKEAKKMDLNDTL